MKIGQPKPSEKSGQKSSLFATPTILRCELTFNADGYGKKASTRIACNNKGELYDPDVVDACLKVFYEKNFAFK
jgi:hypothetical protein